MSTTQKRILWPVVLIALLALGAFAFASARRARGSETTTARAIATQNSTAAVNPDRVNYVRRRALWPQLRKNLEVLGDRLERPGKERMILTGTVKRAGAPVETPFELVREFPDRLQLTEQQGVNRRSTAFNGRADDTRSFTSAESDIIETLLFASVEYFFITRMEGTAASFLGSRFRLDDGTSPNYTGPFYDIFLVNDQMKIGGSKRPRSASYYFNSRSSLLERVRYQRERNGSLVNVEVVMSEWRDFAGQRIPMRVERFENGSLVLKFRFAAAVIGPRASDNIFNL